MMPFYTDLHLQLDEVQILPCKHHDILQLPDDQFCVPQILSCWEPEVDEIW